MKTVNTTGALALVGLNKHYGDNHVVKDLSFSIGAGEFISLLGPSGCGKTTVLRLIAGFETLDSGDIFLDGTSVVRLEPNRRPLQTIFQNYALFPHLTVFENIAYGLRAKHRRKSEIASRVAEALETVQLQGFENRYPAQMSGGQRQRVSIARAIINKPPLLLLDEPLTALDMKLRKEMRFELRQLQQRLGITFIYVTHDQEEALVMSDRIAVMNGGRIEQAGTPAEIYLHPVSQFVAEFIGETNSFDAVVTAAESDGLLTCAVECGSFLARGVGCYPNQLVHVSVRPDKLRWHAAPQPGFELPGVVTRHSFSGPLAKAYIALADGRELFVSRLLGQPLPEIHETVYMDWEPEDAVVMHTVGEGIIGAIENINLGDWVKIVQ